MDGIMGLTVGEERTLESVVGDAWWEPEGLEGIPVRCDVSLKELFEWDVPEVSSSQPDTLLPGLVIQRFILLEPFSSVPLMSPAL